MYLTQRFFNIIDFTVLFIIALLLLPQMVIMIKKKSSATTSITTFISAFLLVLAGTITNFKIRSIQFGMNIGLCVNCVVLLAIVFFAIKYRIQGQAAR